MDKYVMEVDHYDSGDFLGAFGLDDDDIEDVDVQKSAGVFTGVFPSMNRK
jgi:hypothetical protein